MDWILAGYIAAMIVVPRLAVVLLVGASIWIVIKYLPDLWNRSVSRSIILAVFLFLLWTIISTLMSGHLSREWVHLLKVCSLLGAGIIILLHFSKPRIRIKEMPEGKLAPEYAYGVGAAVLAFAVGYALVNGDSLWGSYFMDPLTTLNTNAVMLSLLAWPTMVRTMQQPSLPVICLLSFVVIMLFFMSSGAALVAIFLGLLVLVIRCVSGKRGGMFLALTATILILLAPEIVGGVGAEKYMEPEVVNNSTSSIPYSSRHRMAMWAFATDKIYEKPWLGWGFGASRYIPQEDYRLADNMEVLPLHPHNLALQTRLELGLPGSLILATLTFLVFYRLATFTENAWHSGLAMAPAACWLFVANVSYGMWQSWWIATAFLLFVIMRIALASVSESEKKPSEN